jgi:hypothetical protein
MKKQTSIERLAAWLAAPVRVLSLDETLVTRRSWQARFIDPVAAPDKHTRCLCKRPTARESHFRGNTFDWHAFSFVGANVPTDLGAALGTLAHPARRVHAFAEDCTTPGIEIVFATLQDAVRAREPLLLDVYFAPIDLAWSLAFTHEMRMGLGPYLVAAPP